MVDPVLVGVDISFMLSSDWGLGREVMTAATMGREVAEVGTLNRALISGRALMAHLEGEWEQVPAQRAMKAGLRSYALSKTSARLEGSVHNLIERTSGYLWSLLPV
jgi:hypothetical protein